ncbi:hypothetical protein PACTADRAFT_74801 [Pachysolen tannophilus NRRL Y-2460]|uniref:Cytidyltransferase-like domain-containing protein n=1 Tax=Pachysolen tannophilus NRRL Y-2460 TaxID=669874 RepID=A0A1E4TZT9_PACTA|nr:hypothetical protein PACTADRAFT_74801 [Pachysolen tannophilus NRRL Y-2460]
MNKLDSEKVLNRFLGSDLNFEVIYQSWDGNCWNCENDGNDGMIFAGVKRLCILDSSFNPPHDGHYSLAFKSVKFQFEQDIDEDEDKALLLLLSVKNADKIIPEPVSFNHRINMMVLLADDLSKHLNIKVYVGLTKHAKFVDKAFSILKNFDKKLQDFIKLVFLVGFDTLVRIFDAKYYKPISLQKALQGFMEKVDLFVLTREDDKQNFISLNDQFNYVEKIKLNKFQDIPAEWGQNIYLCKGDNNSLKLSSSRIRKSIKNGDSNWKNYVNEEVQKYIESLNLYK